ncbi:translation initiation factor IF-6 [Methanobacterium sp. ACI-7]|uniref:translation initiation factor IF-6 n=1 Tax=unclassified Methanobacterium TaxID=2627676 RepID=UPI0039C0C259
MIRRANLNGNPNLGVAICATDKVALVPSNLSEVMEHLIEDTLGVPVIKTPISGSNLAGALAVGNSNGFIVSPFAFDREIEAIKEFDLEVERIPDRFTAVGNVILANDNGAVVNPLLSDESLELIGNVLDVEVERGSIANFKITGSVAVATNNGVLAHPSATEDELAFVEGIMKTPADIGTVNKGIKLVGACTVANSNGVIVGQDTTGPELARIEEALGFLEGYE